MKAYLQMGFFTALIDIDKIAEIIHVPCQLKIKNIWADPQLIDLTFSKTHKVTTLIDNNQSIVVPIYELENMEKL